MPIETKFGLTVKIKDKDLINNIDILITNYKKVKKKEITAEEIVENALALMFYSINQRVEYLKKYESSNNPTSSDIKDKEKN